MHNVSIHKAGHLPEAVRSAVEQLLGRSIAAETFLNRRAAKVRDVPEEDIDAVVDEAVHHVRHGRT